MAMRKYKRKKNPQTIKENERICIRLNFITMVWKGLFFHVLFAISVLSYINVHIIHQKVY